MISTFPVKTTTTTRTKEREEDDEDGENTAQRICAFTLDAASSLVFALALPDRWLGEATAARLEEGGAHCVFPRTLRLSVDLSR